MPDVTATVVQGFVFLLTVHVVFSVISVSFAAFRAVADA